MAQIVSIRDEGTIVLVEMRNGEVVYFDHRMFQHMADARDGDLSGECSLGVTEDDERVLMFEDDQYFFPD